MISSHLWRLFWISDEKKNSIDIQGALALALLSCMRFENYYNNSLRETCLIVGVERLTRGFLGRGGTFRGGLRPLSNNGSSLRGWKIRGPPVLEARLSKITQQFLGVQSHWEASSKLRMSREGFQSHLYAPSYQSPGKIFMNLAEKDHRPLVGPENNVGFSEDPVQQPYFNSAFRGRGHRTTLDHQK